MNHSRPKTSKDWLKGFWKQSATAIFGYYRPVCKLPALLREFTGIEVTQGALTQDALKKALAF